MLSASQDLLSKPSVGVIWHGASEVMTGLLWIALAAAIQQTVKWFRAVAARKKFPIAGTYVTKYTDKGRWSTNVVKLRQSGKKVKGENVLSREDRLKGRRWIYDGELKKDGYLHGGYVPETPNDSGFGVFFLKLLRDGDMQGYWLGKDAEEQDVQWGDYKFLKQPNFSISSVMQDDIARVLQIAGQRLGDAYINRPDFDASGDRVALCARVQGSVVGFATARMIDGAPLLTKVEGFLQGGEPGLRSFQSCLKSEARIGYVASAATDPSVSGRGIGAALIGRCIDSLEQKGANVIVATAWRGRDGAQAGSILECKGFKKLLEIPNYWEKESLLNSYGCPTCGKPPCHCTAVLYLRSRHS